jgi:hypothetical protein
VMLFLAFYRWKTDLTMKVPQVVYTYGREDTPEGLEKGSETVGDNQSHN